jgi:DNA repair protein RadC
MLKEVKVRGVRTPVLFGMVREAKGPKVMSSQDVAAHFTEDAKADREWFQVLYLNPKNDIIEQVLEFVGGVDSSAIHPRVVVKHALELTATAVILVHNHPSGDPEASVCDKQVTQSIVRACQLFDIIVLDHVVVGAPQSGKSLHYSMADKGELDEMRLDDARMIFVPLKEEKGGDLHPTS